MAAHALKTVANSNDLHICADDRVDVEVVIKQLRDRACVRGETSATFFVEEHLGGAVTGRFACAELKQQVDKHGRDGALLTSYVGVMGQIWHSAPL